MRPVLLFLFALVCLAGGCGDPTLVSCRDGETPCADGCIDVSSDVANCGACGHACAAGDACVTGACMGTLANSCATNNGGCSAQAQCMDLGSGSVACLCDPGFTGTGQQCAACSTCGASQFALSPCGPTQDTVCASCQAGCMACTGPGATCTACDVGFFNMGGTCVASLCGNGVIEPGEQCDDGGAASGDGCSAACAIELGFYCFGTPSLCRAGGCLSDPLTSLPLSPAFEFTGTGTASSAGLTFSQRSTVRTSGDVLYPVLIEADVVYTDDDLTFVGTRGTGVPDPQNNGESSDTLRARLQEATGAVDLATGLNTLIASTPGTFTPALGVPYHVQYVDDGNSANVVWFNLMNPSQGVGLEFPSRFHTDGLTDRAFVGGGDKAGVTVSNLRVCSAPPLPVTSGLAARYSAIPSWTVAADATGAVFSWQDTSGNGNILTANGANPVFNPGLILGRRPALDFSGGAGLVTAPFNLTTDVTFFAVITQRVPQQWGTIAHHGDRDADWSMEQSGATGDPNTLHWQTNNDNTNMDLTLTQNDSYVLTGIFSGNTRYFSATDLMGGAPLETSIVDGSHTITAGSKPMYVGTSDNNEASNAYIADIVYFSRALSSAERDQVVSYLLQLWQTP